MSPGRSRLSNALRIAGIAVMVIALIGSFFLPLPEKLRWGVVAVIGFAGYGLAEIAKKF